MQAPVKNISKENIPPGQGSDLSTNTTCLPLPSNQSFYGQIASYRMSEGDHEVA